jgi:hypothetical protein
MTRGELPAKSAIHTPIQQHHLILIPKLRDELSALLNLGINNSIQQRHFLHDSINAIARTTPLTRAALATAPLRLAVKYQGQR